MKMKPKSAMAAGLALAATIALGSCASTVPTYPRRDGLPPAGVVTPSNGSKLNGKSSANIRGDKYGSEKSDAKRWGSLANIASPAGAGFGI